MFSLRSNAGLPGRCPWTPPGRLPGPGTGELPRDPLGSRPRRVLVHRPFARWRRLAVGSRRSLSDGSSATSSGRPAAIR